MVEHWSLCWSFSCGEWLSVSNDVHCVLFCYAVVTYEAKTSGSSSGYHSNPRSQSIHRIDPWPCSYQTDTHSGDSGPRFYTVLQSPRRMWRRSSWFWHSSCAKENSWWKSVWNTYVPLLQWFSLFSSWILMFVSHYFCTSYSRCLLLHCLERNTTTFNVLYIFQTDV